MFRERNICMSDGTCVDIRDDIVEDGNEYRMVRRIIVDTLKITGIYLQPPKGRLASVFWCSYF
ncbi:hypothetical protein OESDEN_14867 [Oesophagostomum dentatum]|uniref:Uncharacterized protein n=1 Tax=Oesophagostomum dentatum TaxID=61180 RepID=A0A0B1SJ94_OESDE|nr:hypothetical protein OESDEN_14867 [Oesophagostomum dentatum]